MKHRTPSPLFAGLLTLALVAPAVAATEKSETTQQMLSQSFETISKSLERARDQVSQAVTERDQALDQLATTRRDAAAKDRRIVELEKQLATSQKSGEGWKQKASGLEKTAAEWRQKAHEQARQLAIGAEAQERLGSFRNRLDHTLKEFGALESELSQLRQEMKGPRDVAALLKANQVLKTELGSANRRIQSAVASAAKLKAENEDTLKQLAEAKKSVLVSREREQEARQAMQEVEVQQEKRITMQRVELDHAKQQLAEASRKLDAMASTLERERGATTDKLKTANTQIDQLRQESASRQRQLAEAERKLTSASQQQKELSAALEKRDQAIAELRKKVANPAKAEPAARKKPQNAKAKDGDKKS